MLQFLPPLRDETSQINPLLGNPAPVGPNRRELHLDGLVVEYSTLRGIDDEHFTRLEPTLGANILDGNRESPRLGSKHDEIIRGDHVPRGPKPVAIEHG